MYIAHYCNASNAMCNLCTIVDREKKKYSEITTKTSCTRKLSANQFQIIGDTNHF